MARREVIDCDRCDAKTVSNPVTIHIDVGWIPCPAGGPAERDTRRIDLCQVCAATLLERAVTLLDTKSSDAWFKFATQKIKRGSGS